MDRPATHGRSLGFAHVRAIFHQIRASAGTGHRRGRLLTNPGLLVRSDPSQVVPLLEQAGGPKAQLAAAVYRHSAYIHRDEGVAAATRRHLLALDAARFGDLDLSARFAEAEVPGEPDSHWEVRWATGEQVGLMSVLTRYDAGYVAALAATELHGRKVLVVGQENWTEDGVLRLHDMSTGERLSEPVPHLPRGLSSVATTMVDGRPVAITGHWDETARTWDLITGDRVKELLPGQGERIGPAATAMTESRPVAVIDGLNGTVRLWDLPTRSPAGEVVTDDPEDTTAIATVGSDGRLVIITVTGDAGDVTMWEPATVQRLGPPLASGATALATGMVDGRPVAVTAHDVTLRDGRTESGIVRIYDLSAREQIESDLMFPDRVMALAMAPGGELIVGFGPEVSVLSRR
jgi:hypothetical protein